MQDSATITPDAGTAAGCPVHDAGLPHPTRGDANRSWWPHQLNLRILAKHHPASNPLPAGYDYAAAFEQVDLAQLKADIAEVLTDSKPWWPADFGTYGPLMIRMAWHSAGTYRVHDGRGGGGSGQQRFAPLNSWPDNANLDKARRLLWPVKQKWGQQVSWADLMILAGNVALEEMGFETFGFSGGREDVWEPDADVYWGPETSWLADERYRPGRELEEPLAAVQMGLIYVNPEGPNGNPDPLAAARDIRETFGRMAMNDEETVALIAGGHTFGKAHGAAPDSHLGPDPEAAPLHEQGMGWTSSHGSGAGADTITSGLEVTWTTTPAKWSNDFFRHLFEYEWELTTGPGGAHQWRPVGDAGAGTVPDAHVEGRTHAPSMLTTDLALRVDPDYEKVSRRFYEDPAAFADAFARAWFKLTHRDLGPKARYVGPEVPAEDLIWQDPLPAAPANTITEADVPRLKELVREAGLDVPQLVSAAWASASTFRSSDRRGGANGARVRLEPQRSWAVNDPQQLAATLEALEGIRTAFHAESDRVVSLADLIVLAGGVAVEQAAAAAGHEVTVPFTPGRVDAGPEHTDAESFEPLEPLADGFRNYLADTAWLPAEHALVDRANLLGLSAPQMTVLVGGLRVLGANHGGSREGVFTDRVGTLSTDFFTNLLDIDTRWEPTDETEQRYVGHAADGSERWTATRVDLAFGSNSELRALAEVYASDDARESFIEDFVAAWVQVMEADRFDLKG